MTVLAQVFVYEFDHACGNGKSKTFTSAGLSENKSIDPNHVTFHIHQGTSAVAGVDGSVGLDIHHGLIWFWLARDRADDAHRHSALQAFGAANGDHKLPLPHTAAASK